MYSIPQNPFHFQPIRFIFGGVHLRHRAKSVALLLKILHNVRQRLHGLPGGFGVVHQHHADIPPLGLTLDIAQNLCRVGVAGGSILGADVPVDPMQTPLLGLGFEAFHYIAAAVPVADRVGAAAGKAQPFQRIGVKVGAQSVLQFRDIAPECVGASVNFGVLVAGAVQGDLMPRCQNIRDFGQIRFVCILRTDKPCGRNLVLIQNLQNGIGVFARTVVKGQADHLGQRRVLRGGCGKAVVGCGGFGIFGVVEPVRRQRHPCQQRQRRRKNEPILLNFTLGILSPHGTALPDSNRICYSVCGGLQK